MKGFVTLPNGTHVRPEYVQMVEAAEAVEPIVLNGKEITKGRLPSVVIHIGGRDDTFHRGNYDRRVIGCESFEAAEVMRDRIRRDMDAVTQGYRDADEAATPAGGE